MKQFLRGSRWYCVGFGVLALMTYSTSALAEDYFPDLNIETGDKEFRKAVVEAISSQTPVMTFRSNGQVHEYHIKFDRDYFDTRRFYCHPLRIRNKEVGEPDDFLTLLEKTTFISRSSPLEHSRKYGVFIKRPRNTDDHQVDQREIRVNPEDPTDYKVPFISGSFLCALMPKPENYIYDLSKDHPDLQGPYFSFTLTEIPKEYLSTHIKMKALRSIKDLIKQFIRGQVDGAETFQKAKNTVDEKTRARAQLIQKFTQRYKHKAWERASKAANESTHPATTFYDSYQITREDLNAEEIAQLDALDIKLTKARDKEIRLYAKHVATHLTPRYLVPYIQANFSQEDLFGHNLNEEDSDSEDTQLISESFIEYILEKIGPQVFVETRRNLGLE
jgi:hypothetical protein